MSTLRSILFLSFLAPAIARAQTQPNPDSVRAQRARMVAQASEEYKHKVFTHADTLRGSLTPERAWWDIQRYDITVKPDFLAKMAPGSDLITYKVISDVQPGMQLDLQAPLHIDSVIFNGRESLPFTQEGNAWHVKTPRQKVGSVNTVQAFFSGVPHESTRPPWSGGWTFAKDSLGRPWMTVTCQGMGASLWYPCKDLQYDEPDKGGSVTMIVPDSLVAVSSGRLQQKRSNGDGTTTYKWGVVNPISNYCLIPYIGKYVTFHEDFQGEKGHLDLDYWVLDYNLPRAKDYMPTQVHNMLHAFEHWFGPYPFYEDSYKLVDVQHTGMEHQSAVAYGNSYAFGYRGRDGSGTGIGMKYDFIIIHESGHEWFGNNLTTKDLADMWVHEGFTNYSETLFADYMWGVAAGNAYNYGTRRGIRNDRPVIPRYGVNEQGSGDMYPKGGNLLQSIRHSIDNDEQWRQILRGLNKDFYHQTVTTQQVEHYVSEKAGFDYGKVFDQYLRTTQIPDLEYYFSDDHKKVSYRYTNCIAGFDLPLVLSSGGVKVRILPTDQWKSSELKGGEAALFTEEGISNMYYIGVKANVVPSQRGGGGGVKWGKDGKSYYAIENNALVRYDLPGFQKTVVLDAALLTPPGQSQPLAVQAFSFSDDEKKILLYTNSKKVWRLNTRGDYWVLDLNAHTLKQLGKSRPASSLMFAKIAPDGTKAAYTSEHNVYVEDLASGAITPLTTDGTFRLINGTFDWVYEEEFGCRDGFRWSPDSKSIAYWQIDANQIRNFLMIDNTDSLYPFTIPVEYPKAGQDPSPCKVGVVSLATGKTVWMLVPGDSRQHYIPRMEWAGNSTELVLEQLNRKQNEAKVFICNAATGAAGEIYTETDKAWIDVKGRWSDDIAGWEWINGGKDFLWVSEKDGWRHIYRISRDGKTEVLLTKGNYDLIRTNAIDEKAGYVYFMASPDNATQQYLYRVSLDGKAKLELMSPMAQKGTHNYNISPGALYATHNFSNHSYESVNEWVSLPKHTNIKTNEPLAAGGRGGNERPRYPVKMFQVTTDDNVTMDGWMILPKDFDSTKKYPVLFFVYTEPAGATVKDVAGSAGTPLYAGDIAADGYIQISLDGRGTPAPKGAAWRKSIYRKIGIINIRDQAMAAKKIMLWPFVDTSRIAVHGWSGGGSTTLNLLFQYPDIYKTGIAIAPVANQLLYDNIYQERYMGLPQENKEDFVNGSPLAYAKNLRGNLLIVHGTGDDNVHYQGTEMLINELVKYDRKFQVMVYPNRTHAIREGEGTSLHLSHLFTDYLREHCPGGGH